MNKQALLRILRNPTESQTEYVVRYDRGDEYGYYCHGFYGQTGFEVLSDVKVFQIFTYEEVKNLDSEELNDLLRKQCDVEDLKVDFEYISLYDLVLEYLEETL